MGTMLRTDTKPLKMSLVYGPSSGFNLPMGASKTKGAQSGSFAKKDASGDGDYAGDTDAELVGWVNSPSETTGTTAGDTVYWCYNSPDARFLMPLRYDNATYTVNYAESLRGETTDLIVISNVQYANPTTSSEDTVVIYDGKPASSATANDSFVLVGLNSNKMYATGAAD